MKEHQNEEYQSNEPVQKSGSNELIEEMLAKNEENENKSTLTKIEETIADTFVSAKESVADTLVSAKEKTVDILHAVKEAVVAPFTESNEPKDQ